MQGQFNWNPNGQVNFIPPFNFVGTLIATYRVFDGILNSFIATLRLNVTNTPPVAVNDGPYNISHNFQLSVGAPGLLANDFDADGDTLRALLAVEPNLHPAGNLTLNLNGSFTYVPPQGFVGPDHFWYFVTDGLDPSANNAWVDLYVTNALPVARDDYFTVIHDRSTALNVLANDIDGDGDPMAAKVVTNPVHGTVIPGANGDPTTGLLVYTPDPLYLGADSFTYRVYDPYGTTFITATVYISVINNAPLAVADTYTVAHNHTLVVPASGILANDFDADGDAIAAVYISGPANGTLSLSPNGSFLYTPTPNYIGADSFLYAATDGLDVGSPTVVNIVITNAAPFAIDDTYSIPHNQSLEVPAPGVLANDFDIDGDPITAQYLGGPTY
ncbi:MAG: tandem-95 repeat protein, partial [Planctomycetes bacterium]|nr:tandem-95 repeat protein [Planctomycetota bacterium]